jgi:hypothetical protein
MAVLLFHEAIRFSVARSIASPFGGHDVLIQQREEPVGHVGLCEEWNLLWVSYIIILING